MTEQRQTDENLIDFFDAAEGTDAPATDGLAVMSFGEYLVDKGALDRVQLLRALQMQDRNPGVRLGECVAALGFLDYRDIETHLAAWNGVAIVEA